MMARVLRIPRARALCQAIAKGLAPSQ